MSTAPAVFVVDPEFFAKFPIGIPPVPTLVCRYNPKELKIKGGGEWSEPESNQQHDLVAALFTKPSPRTMTLQLFLEGDALTAEVTTLFDWTRPRRSLTPIPKGQASAPWLRLQWGAKHYFRCYIESLDVNYTMFSTAGVPIRATAALTLKETADPLPFTNPTSGGQGTERSHRVVAGDSLHSIAYHHYGQPRLWRGLAAVNGIDDPMRLPAGVVVNLPAAAVVEELS